MQVISVNVGLPRLIEYRGEPISTGIFKSPVNGKIAVNEFNLVGDAQADLRVHGGSSKAVYAYPSEHYDFWRLELPEINFEYGNFGENLTTTNLSETTVCIGDRFRIGSAEFVVTEPRFPCFKLGLRFCRKDIIRRFQKSGRCGFYLAVEKTGELEIGDEVEVILRDARQFSIAEAFAFSENKFVDLDKLRSVLEIEALPKKWKNNISRVLAKHS
jgi:MOSC domain-containing protein YiiM